MNISAKRKRHTITLIPCKTLFGVVPDGKADMASKLNHSKHGPREEIEAHYFAAQANAPNAIIRVIAARGYKIDVPFLIKCFGMSSEAANKKMSYLRKYGFNHTNDYDDSLVAHYFDFINTN